jgi:hypothetical protein
MPFLTDGYQTLIEVPGIVGQPVLLFREREVQPPDLDGGGPIETTTMRNTRFRTKQPKHLITTGDITTHVQYAPQVYDDVLRSLQIVGKITIRFPDGYITVFIGWLEKFTPTSLKEGDFPLAEMKLCVGNQLLSRNSVILGETPPNFTNGPVPANFVLT